MRNIESADELPALRSRLTEPTVQVQVLEYLLDRHMEDEGIIEPEKPAKRAGRPRKTAAE